MPTNGHNRYKVRRSHCFLLDRYEVLTTDTNCSLYRGTMAKCYAIKRLLVSAYEMGLKMVKGNP